MIFLPIFICLFIFFADTLCQTLNKYICLLSAYLLCVYFNLCRCLFWLSKTLVCCLKVLPFVWICHFRFSVFAPETRVVNSLLTTKVVTVHYFYFNWVFCLLFRSLLKILSLKTATMSILEFFQNLICMWKFSFIYILTLFNKLKKKKNFMSCIHLCWMFDTWIYLFAF